MESGTKKKRNVDQNETQKENNKIDINIHDLMNNIRYYFFSYL